MTSNKTSLFHVGFAVVVLLVVDHIRSGVLVDTSFLPRFFLLTVVLLVASVSLARRTARFRISFFEACFLLFYLWNLLSSLWARVPSEAVAQSQLVFVSFSVYLVVTMHATLNSRFERTFIRISILAMLFAFSLAFYKMYRLEFFDPYRIISVSANNNLFSGYLFILLPLALAGYALFRGFWKYLSAAAGTMALFFIVIVQSRAVYVGLMFATLLALAILLTRYRFLFTRKNLLVGGLCLLLLAAGISCFYSSLDQPRKNYFLSKIPVWQYFKSYDDSLNEQAEKRRKEKAALTGIAEFDFAGSYYENASLRVIFWKKSACLVAAHPLLGVGAGNWRINVASCPKPVNPDHTFKNYTYSQPHNEWVGFLSELGIPGFLLAVFLFFTPVIIVFFRIMVRREKMPVVTVFYASFLAGFYLFACFDFPFKRIEHNVLLFSILAFLLLKIPMKGWCVTSRRKAWKYVALFLIAGLTFTAAVVLMRTRGEYYTRLMFRNEGKDQEKVIFYGRQAGSWFYRLTPNTLPVDWFIGVAQFRQGDLASAGNSFREALEITPWEVRVMNDDATSLYQQGRVAEARAELQKTLAVDPFFDDARFNLAAIHFYRGNYDTTRILVEGCRDSQKKRDFLKELEVFPVIRSEDRH
ncbi:MAG: O-antigen ligase family protein [Bacteroidetes bacterium]|nr:O-antigen ligase family protein [Bacteroidota bacterium]